ncbi:MAG: DUF421 domain-containing protein [Ruminococcaceae bacterium]|nr:DUF421 domain-containing protein [Oscillospiraceae bacterium]
MLTVLLRTAIIYVLLIFSMRLMGKRQIGELEISDLVTTFLISEIASLPITEPELPLSHAIVPIVALLTFEITISFLTSRFPKFKHLFTARPSTLIRDGEICQKALLDARLSFDELFSELRQQGIDDISQIKYAILEQNGKITVIQKAPFRQPTAREMQIKVKETGLFHIVVEHGCINRHGITQVGLSESTLYQTLAKKGLNISDIYLMLVNDIGEQKIILKEKK